jgi:membrane associated rhomboid family serine protease
VFFPIRDNAPRPVFPYATFILVALNLSIFFVQQLLPEGLATRLFYAAGAVPFECAHMVDVKGTGLHAAALVPPPLTVLTSMFLHGGILHVLGNLVFLWIFGDNVEKALGPGKFVVFYFLAGSVATAAQIAMTPSSMVPIVGASGAIASILGAYLVLFPRARVEVVMVIPFFVQIVIVPAFVVLGIWILWQLLAGSGHGSIAFWAHIGGFLAGGLLCKLFARRGAKPALARGALWPRIAPGSSSSPL